MIESMFHQQTGINIQVKAKLICSIEDSIRGLYKPLTLVEAQGYWITFYISNLSLT